MRPVLPLILLLLHALTLTLTLAPQSAVAGSRSSRVNGMLSWKYADYQAEDNAVTTATDVDASSFSQHYSLIYRDRGELNGGRGGQYAYGLGAEFVGIDNNINGAGESLTTYKPFYEGQIVIAPGGLPFRLKLFSSDTHITTLLEDSNPRLMNIATFAPEIATDFSNGRHRRTAATLAVGIQNGSYLGGYRDTLSQFPRLLMDYQEYEVESFRSKSPQNYRTRDLAFVSLNKKENWFHYRFRDYQDFLQKDGRNDYQTKTYLIGTIDPLLQRNWINMTNWIKVSADGSFTQTSGVNAFNSDEEKYQNNLFVVANRERFRSSTFTSHRRKREGGELNQALSVPVTLSSVVDRNTSWHLNVNADSARESMLDTITEDEKNFYFSFVINTRESRPFTLSPSLKSEVFERLGGHGNAHELGFSLRSKPRNVSTNMGILSLFLRRFSGEVEGRAVDYVEQELIASLARRQFGWSLGAEESLQLGNGTMSRSFGRYVAATTLNSQTYTDNIQSDRDGTTFHTITRLFGTTDSGRTVSNRIDILIDYLKTQDVGNLQMGGTHLLTVNKNRTFIYVMTNELSLGEGQTANSGALAGGELRVVEQSNVSRYYGHTSSFKFMPHRSLTGHLDFKLKSQWSDGGGRSLHYGVNQGSRYTFFRVNGIVRSLFSVSEELTYEAASSDDSETEMLLNANYAPFRHLTFEAFYRYEHSVRSDWEQTVQTSSLSAHLSYALVSLRLRYDQGISSTGSYESKDHGVKIQLDKVF